MANHGMRDLADRIEADADAANDLAQEILTALATAGLAAATDADAARITACTDDVLVLVDRAFPGWSIALDGVASLQHGHWTCVLRHSDAQDNDAYLGVGKSDRLPVALMAALLKAMALRPAG